MKRLFQKSQLFIFTMVAMDTILVTLLGSLATGLFGVASLKKRKG